MKQIFLALIAFLTLLSCSKDDDSSNNIPSNGIFISINGDTRTLSSASNEDGYDIELSSYLFNGNASEPEGVQLVMDVYDIDQEYIGDIGDYTGCTEIEVYADIFTRDFSNPNIKTIFDEGNLTSSEKENKCELYIRLKGGSDDVIIAGSSVENQTVTISKQGNTYEVEFTDLNFKSNEGETFTASGRIITN